MRVPVAALISLLVATPSAALDELLPGTTLVLRQRKKAERFVLVARASLPAPLPGGSEDPRFTGALVDIGNPATNEWARLNAPSAGWSVNPLGTLFRFRNASPKDRRDEPLSIVIRHGKRMKVVGHAIGITLDEPKQDDLAVVITSGTRRYCLLFGGRVDDDEPGRFVAHSAPIPSSCPTFSGSPTPTTSTTTSTRRNPGETTTTTTATTPHNPSSSSTTTLRASTTSTTQAPDDGDPCDNLDVPDGHRPGRGQCRIWFPGRPPGHQPAAGPCEELEEDVPEGACLLRG